MNNSVKNQVIYTIFGTQNASDQISIGFFKIGCFLNSRLLQHLPSETSDKQNCRNRYGAYHTRAPKVIKIG